MDSRRVNEDYQTIAEDLIQNEPSLAKIKESSATIICLSSSHKKTKEGGRVYGQCEKISEKYKWSIPCDYTITIFEPNIIGFSEKQIRILIFHELLHIQIDIGEDGQDVYSTRGHDLEDFKEIIDRWGTDWAEVKDDPEAADD